MKDRELTPLPTIVFFLSLVIIVWYYIIRTGEIAPLPIQQIVEGPQSQSYALYYTRLINLDTNQEPPLNLPNMKNHVGQIVMHPDGDWIINQGAQDFFFLKAIKRLIKGRDSLHKRIGTLLKCDPQFNHCKPWGEAELQFERAFDGMAVKGHQLLLFNPFRKMTYLVSSNGIILDTLVMQQYWVGAALYNDQLIATNTQSGTIDRLSIKKDKIVIDEDIIDLTALDDGKTQLKFLSKIFYYANRFWLAGRQYSKTLDDSGDITFLPDPNKPKSIIMLSDDLTITDTEITTGDLADFELIGGALYFTNYEKDEIKRFDLTQRQLKTVTSESLQQAIFAAEKNQEIQKTSLYKQLGLLSIPSILSFIWLIISSKSTTSSFKEKTGLFRGGKKLLFLDKTEAPEPTHSSDIVDIPFRRKKYEKFAIFYGYLLIIAYVFSLGLLAYSLGIDSLLLLLNNPSFLGSVILMPLYCYYLARRYKTKKLFVQNGILYWEKSPHNIYQFEPESLVYSNLSFADRNIYVSPNSHQKQTYDKEVFVQYVLPIIKQGQYLKPLKFAMHYFQHQFTDVLIHSFFWGFILTVIKT